MIDPIIHSSAAITLIGGGEATTDDLNDVLSLAPICVAADGGVVLALQAGVMPKAVLGDFDSAPAAVLDQIPLSRLHRIDEQDTTDFEKALARIDAPVIVGVGFMGGRIDHQLAALHGLLAFADRPCVLLAGDEVILLAPPKIALPTRAGEVVSLFPLAGATGRSTGLQWPIEGLNFALGEKIGTSNAATGPMSLQMEQPGLALILPRRLMPDVVAAFCQPDAARWPARDR